MRMQKIELAQKLNKLRGVVPKKTTLPVLQGILVRDGYFIANNLQMTVKAKIGGAEGETFIIPERAFDLINNLPDGEVHISATEKNVIAIKADKIENKYCTMEPEQFPVMKEPEEGSELTIQADLLLRSMKRISYAVPMNHTNTVMCSMCLHAAGGTLNFVGLDGHVLAWDKIDCDGDFKLLIPKNAIDKIKTLDLCGDVKIKHGKTGAVFITEDFEIYTRLVEGEYFQYQTMFGKLPLQTVISRMEFLDAMTRAKMCNTEERCPVKFELAGNSLHVTIKDKMTDYQEVIGLLKDMPEELTIGFDAKLVLDTLKAFDHDKIKISFGGARLPMMVAEDNSEFKAIVLPVKLA